MNRKVTVVGGAGNVGATVARAVAHKELADVVVVDLAETKAQGIALDIYQSCPVAGSSAKVVGYGATDEGFAAIGKEPSAATPEEQSPPEKPKRVSKQSTMLDMLRQGTTIQAIMDVTNWQKHTVHGSMANLKKKLGLTIASDKAESGERTYRIA